MQIFSLEVTLGRVARFFAAFAVIFLAAKLGQYLFFHFQTSPAVLWPPAGIALALIWFYGYRYALPVFFGLLASSLTGPTASLIPAVVTTPLAQTAGGIVGAWLLKYFRFTGSFSVTRNVLVMLGVVLLSSVVAPTVTTAISYATGNLASAAYYSWSRAYAGYVFSAVVFFPLIISWLRPRRLPFLRSPLESMLAGALLFFATYFLFWTRIAAEYSFLFFGFFFVIHFWIGFRFPSRIVTLSAFVSTVAGFLGLFLSPAPGTQLNNQLFSAELFLLLSFPTFFAFSALVKERIATIEQMEEVMYRIRNESDIKNEFIAVLAHELRNPLAPVKTTLELMGLQNPDPETKKLIASANEQIRSMKRLLDDLLDITRVTQGKFRLQVERVNLCDLLDKAVEATKYLYAERRHQLVMDPKCDPTIWLDVDPVRFEQIIVNILHNAAKYTPPGGRVEISHRLRGGMVELLIKDNGMGIEKEYLEHIFEPFWQKKVVNQSGGGIGVGLSLTKRIVELHHGAIEVESQGRGKGSTFLIRIPAATGSFSESESVIRPTPPPVPGKVKTPMKVLVVDDNQAAADSLARLLALKGYSTQAVYEGSRVFDAVVRFAPRAIVLDIGMPGMNGYEVAKKLRDLKYTGALIAVSGYGQEEDKQKAVEAGFDRHFTKPLASQRLIEFLLTLP